MVPIGVYARYGTVQYSTVLQRDVHTYLQYGQYTSNILQDRTVPNDPTSGKLVVSTRSELKNTLLHQRRSVGLFVWVYVCVYTCATNTTTSSRVWLWLEYHIYR